MTDASTTSKETAQPPKQQAKTSRNAPAKSGSQRKSGSPSASDLTPVLLGYRKVDETVTQEPICLPYASRDQGFLITGATGTGKSAAIKNLVQQDWKNGTPCVVFDPHGELTQQLLNYAAYYRVPNVYVLEVDSQYPYGVNICRPKQPGPREITRRVDLLLQVLKKKWEEKSWGPQLEDVLRSVGHTLMVLPEPTLLDIQRLFHDEAFRKFCLAKNTNKEVKYFWEEYDLMSNHDKREFKSSTLNKIREFTINPEIAHIVGQAQTTVDFQALFEEEASLLISLPKGELGDGNVELFGTLWLIELATTIYTHRPKKRVHVYIDEYGRFCTPWTTDLLKEGRKFNVGTTVAHQTRADLKDEASREAELQMGSLMAFRGTPDDGNTLAMKYKLEPQLEVIGEKEARAFEPKPLTYLTTLTPRGEVAHPHENEEVRQILEQIEFCWKRFLPLLDQWILALEEGRLVEGSADELMLLKEMLTTKNTVLIDRHPLEPGFDIDLEPNVDHDLSYCWHYNLLPGFSDYTRNDKTAARYQLYPQVYEHLYELIDQLAKYRGQPFWDSLTYWDKMLEDVGQKAKQATTHWKDEFNVRTRRLLSERGLAQEAEGYSRAAFDTLYHYLKDQQATHNYYTCHEYNPSDYQVLTPSVQQIKRPVFITLTSILSMLRLGHLISKFPVTIRSGRTEPITRPRPLGDIKLEQANNLATFNNHEAMVRLQIAGETFTTPNFQQAHILTVKPESPQADPEDLEDIRKRSRERFGRPVEQVEQEIVARHAEHSQPSQRKRRIRAEEEEA